MKKDPLNGEALEGCHRPGADKESATQSRRERELDEANAQLRQENIHLAQVDKKRADFFNDVSHEFRTPLTLLLWSIEQLQRSPDQLDDNQRRSLSAAKRNADRLLRLANTLLDFARAESGRIKATYQPTDLPTLTAELVSQFRSAVEQAGLRLVVECPPLPHPVYVDREMWEKIILNLLSNAFKFTLAGEVRVSLKKVDGFAKLSVQDTGSGIPEDELALVFERFYRAKGTKARSGEGTGIGLSLVRELVHLHHGEVRGESRYGKGSTFTVEIPFGRAHLPANLVKEEESRDTPPSQASAYLGEIESWLPSTDEPQSVESPGGDVRPRILVVDDNADVGVAISRLLGQRFRTQTITDGTAALESVYGNPPDVLVTDLLMSGLGGLDLVRSIRTDPRVSALPIIIVSGNAAEETRSFVLEAGADDFLVKPFSARELLARVSTLVDQAQRSRLERSLRAEAEAARSRMNMVLESVSEAFLAVDSSWRVTFANGRATDWLGKSRADLVDHALAEVLPDSAEGDFRTVLQRAMRQRQSSQLEQRSAERWWMIGIYPASEGLVLLAADITARKAAEKRMFHLARHDMLTGLPNRALLYEVGEHKLAAQQRSGDTLAVLFFNLDRFKPINDTYGHKVGDELLRQVAQRIFRSLRPEDWLARLSGDEFVVLLPRVASARDAAHAAAHALEVLRPPVKIEGLELYTLPSIGISLFPQDGDHFDALIQRADAAMQYAKDFGGNNYQFYTESIGSQAQATISIENRLRRGLERGEFELYYQPVVNTMNGKLTSLEALLRWPQPDQTNISPDVFIPIAESAGLLQALGQWVFTEACGQHCRWQREGLPPIHVAVNVSATQFRDRNFRVSLERALGDTDINPCCVSLELTESALMKDVGTAVDHLRAFRKIGIQVALDDFGTGYSSLSQLAQLPLDKLKIDRSFIHNVERGGVSPAIVEAILALGRTLNLEIVAEGVETVECFDFLRDRKCDHVQGFYFGRPMPAAEFARWYRDREITLS